MLLLFYLEDDKHNNLDYCIHILEHPDAVDPYLFYCARGSLYKRIDCNYWVLCDIRNIGSIYHYVFQNKSGNTDYRDQMLLAATLSLYDNLRTLLENLQTDDLDLLYCYNLSDDKNNNLSVFLYIHSDDIVHKVLFDVHLLMETESDYDQK